jgi:hypothetical protein
LSSGDGPNQRASDSPDGTEAEQEAHNSAEHGETNLTVTFYWVGNNLSVLV